MPHYSLVSQNFGDPVKVRSIGELIGKKGTPSSSLYDFTMSVLYPKLDSSYKVMVIQSQSTCSVVLKAMLARDGA